MACQRENLYFTDDDRLFSHTWQLVQIQGRKLDALSNSNLRFDKRTNEDLIYFGAFGVCNQLFGKVEITDTLGGISFSNVGSTFIGCDKVSQEQFLANTLQNVKSYRLTEGFLMLLDRNGVVRLTYRQTEAS
ncbi:META domain-containing protein [Penaeicola halotolerans]|uniref:META domain-containing protein n=1 Tax=Penaeicola halotolerans TaxID=2793196 RepID=UPI001CF86DD0|nr:META domain-containing protein [Penaeicola halotolerans]